MDEPLREYLIKKARKNELVYYSEIAPGLGLDMSQQADRTEIGRVLGELSDAEHAEGRPLLSAIVVSKESSTPGPGYFKLAKSLGVSRGDPDADWLDEVKRIFEYWTAN